MSIYAHCRVWLKCTSIILIITRAENLSKVLNYTLCWHNMPNPHTCVYPMPQKIVQSFFIIILLSFNFQEFPEN